MIRTETQNEIISFLTANPESNVDRIVAGIGKNRNAVHGVLIVLASKGLCERVQRIRGQWTYRAVYVPSPKVAYMGELAKGRVSGELVQLYKCEPWLSARPGADDHKRHQSMGALSKFKGQA